MKKCLIIFGLSVLFFAASPAITGETGWKEKENRLLKTSGKERIEILVQLTEYYREREPKKALAYGGEARELLKTVGDFSLQTALLIHLGTAHTNLGNYKDARDCAHEALELAEKTGNPKGTADALVCLAFICNRESSYDLSISRLKQAKTIYEKLGDREGMADAFFTFGLNYFKMSDYSAALENALEAAKIYESLGDKDRIADSANNIGRIYGELTDYDNALVYFKKYLETSKENGYMPGSARALHNISFIYLKQGKFSEAMNYAKQALIIKEELGEPREIALTVAIIGGIYKEMNNYPLALKQFERSLEISKELEDREFMAGNFYYIGMIKRETGKHAEALSLLKQSEALAHEIGALDDERDAVRALSETYADMKNFEESLKYYQKYKELNDRIFNEQNSSRISELQTRYDMEKKELELMKKNEQIHQLNLARQKYITNSLIVISFLVVLSALALYARYRLKVRAHRLLEKEIHEHKKTARELLRSHKMESLGILAGGIAHDFNNLLGVILGFLTMIKENVREDKSTLKMVESVEEASKQAAVLSDKFLTLSHGKWLTIQKLNIEDILKSTAEHHPEVGYLLGNVSLPPDLKPLNGDERQLREVFFNFLKNADESMSEPKELIISAENITLESENDFSLEKGDYVKIIITDNGRGIPPEQLDKIFDPYFSTKDTPYQKGMGLGLAVCYAIIKQHGGHISIRSEMGNGTTVELYLPAFTSANAPCSD